MFETDSVLRTLCFRGHRKKNSSLSNGCIVCMMKIDRMFLKFPRYLIVVFKKKKLIFSILNKLKKKKKWSFLKSR